jgi:hypothetical protein
VKSEKGEGMNFRRFVLCAAAGVCSLMGCNGAGETNDDRYPPEVRARLKDLETVRETGEITEKEYKEKREAIVKGEDR